MPSRHSRESPDGVTFVECKYRAKHHLHNFIKRLIIRGIQERLLENRLRCSGEDCNVCIELHLGKVGARTLLLVLVINAAEVVPVGRHVFRFGKEL